MEALLLQLRPAAHLDEATFTELVRSAATSAAGRSSSPSAALAGPPWPAHDALLALLAHSAHAAVPPADLHKAVRAALPEDRAEQVASVYAEALAPCHATLDGCALGCAELIDVRWARNGVAAASMREARAAGGSLYVVTLVLRERDGMQRTVPFATSFEGLSDLAAKVKGAVKQVERECEGA
ncbi:hypothetical protein AB1Y20_015421 [Prymnesium parvum]|uniref:COMM domain-containing protein 3 n=1 Tax=Prymnesium parvum TaxID=97485 RepID=A0AB34JWQ6_PRYPA